MAAIQLRSDKRPVPLFQANCVQGYESPEEQLLLQYNPEDCHCGQQINRFYLTVARPQGRRELLEVEFTG